MGLSIYSLYRLIQPGFRTKRLQLLIAQFRPTAATRILDVGGYAGDWQDGPVADSSVTLLNLSFPPGPPLELRFHCVEGDARRLPFADGSFDLAFSNSVIEHVGEFADQQRFAAEIRRVGRGVFVQTPNRWFFIEPHFITPFLHYLPRRLARPLLRVFSLRAWLRRGDNVDLRTLAKELRLLSYREVKELFPDCEIHRERWLGMTKSFILLRRVPPPAPVAA